MKIVAPIIFILAALFAVNLHAEEKEPVFFLKTDEGYSILLTRFICSPEPDTDGLLMGVILKGNQEGERTCYSIDTGSSSILVHRTNHTGRTVIEFYSIDEVQSRVSNQ